MTISKLKILLDLNKGNEQAVLEEHACLTRHGYFFVDSIDGQCWLFDQNGKLDDIKKIDAMLNGYAKKDIKKIVIPKCVKRIEDWAFAYCASLTSIEIPESIKSIGNGAFWNCESLTNIEIPNSVKNIEYEAFWGCKSLKSIEIPKSVESIGSRTFSYCISLTSIIFKGKTIDQAKAIGNYPWGIEDESVIKCS